MEASTDRKAIFMQALKNQGIRESNFLAADFRTGSTLLGRLLNLQSGLDFQRENFNTVPTWHSLNPSSLRQSISNALNPVVEGRFATKIMWPQRNNLSQFLGLDPTNATSLVDVFPDARFLLLVRQDKAAQAVSYHIARRSNVWDSRKNPAETDVPYIFNEINRYYMHFLSFEILWRQFLDALDCPFRVFTYEEMIKDLKATVHIAASLFRFEFENSLFPDEEPLKKQQSQLAAIYRDRFVEDLHRYSPTFFLPGRLTGPAGP